MCDRFIQQLNGSSRRDNGDSWILHATAKAFRPLNYRSNIIRIFSNLARVKPQRFFCLLNTVAPNIFLQRSIKGSNSDSSSGGKLQCVGVNNKILISKPCEVMHIGLFELKCFGYW